MVEAVLHSKMGCLLGASAAMMLLAGCELLPGRTQAPEQTAVAQPKAVEPSADVKDDHGSDGEVVVVPPVKPALPKAALMGEPPSVPSSLIGQSLGEVQISLGPPLRVRDEKPALVYEYQTKRCTLSIVFLMDIERNMFRALSYDIRAQGEERSSPEQCLAAIRKSGERS